MSATEPRYCPVSTLLSTCAALPSIRRRRGGIPGYSAVSEAAGDHPRDESRAPGRRCGPRHLRRPSRRSAANWRQGGNPAATTVCRRAGRCGCYCRWRQAPPAEICRRGPARREAPDHAREAGDQGRSEDNASQCRARGYGNDVGNGKDRSPTPSRHANTECLPATWRRSGRDERNPSWPYQHSPRAGSRPSQFSLAAQAVAPQPQLPPFGPAERGRDGQDRP